jgi:hypothetical protein
MIDEKKTYFKILIFQFPAHHSHVNEQAFGRTDSAETDRTGYSDSAQLTGQGI